MGQSCPRICPFPLQLSLVVLCFEEKKGRNRFRCCELHDVFRMAGSAHGKKKALGGSEAKLPPDPLTVVFVSAIRSVF